MVLYFWDLLIYPCERQLNLGVCKTRNTRNTLEHPGTPRNTPGTSHNTPNTPKHPIIPRNTLNTARSTLEHQK